MPARQAVSVIINTLNRAASLRETLQSLRHLNYRPFEVIVVNGPSTDDTASVLEEFSSMIRVGTCADRNLSVSRNVGLAMARGEFVAFLDDDAIPEEDWLHDLMPLFDHPHVAGVGGQVIDYTGYRPQYGFSAADRFGNGLWDLKEPQDHWCFPGASITPYLQGTNAIFRLSAVEEIGGFDEEYDYSYDETDLCTRLVDAGYSLRQVAYGRVFHRFLASHIRTQTRVPTNWFPIVKNKLYYGIKNRGEASFSFRELCQAAEKHAVRVEQELRMHVDNGNITPLELERFLNDVGPAMEAGVLRGLHSPRRLTGTQAAEAQRGAVAYDTLAPERAGLFHQFPVIERHGPRLTIALISQEYPPGVVGGIGRHTYVLARALARLGHRIHVLTKSRTGHNTVDWEEGVWVHRLVASQNPTPKPSHVPLPDHLWHHSYTMLEELKRIREMHAVDIVEAPVWDAEGYATICDGSFVNVTFLQTPLLLAVETNPDWVSGDEEQLNDWRRRQQAETLVCQRAEGVRAISNSVRESIERLYGISFDPDRVRTIPLGLPDVPKVEIRETGPRVFFVGRFELRKGIDVLLEAIPLVSKQMPSVRFDLVGRDRDGAWEQKFWSANKGHLRQNVRFWGELPDEEMDRLCRESSVVVMPSRYESFGLVLLEAMRVGKPVVASRAGGMAEIVRHQETGLLVPPADAQALADAILTVLSNDVMRASMSTAARLHYERHYSDEHVAEASVAFYQHVMTHALQPA